MKKVFLLVTIIVLALFISGCEKEEENDNKPERPYEEAFAPVEPYQALSSDILKVIGADGFNGSNETIANQILTWQKDNMQFISNPEEKEDLAYPMRWNYFLPGIYPVKEMVVERKLSNGKIYGLCWDYAAIYASIAKSYDLEVRITAVKKHLSDLNPEMYGDIADGLPEYEYDELTRKFIANEVFFTYDQVDRVANETWIHYRAEVNLNGVWTSMDGTDLTNVYENEEFEVVEFDEGYNYILLNGPSIVVNDKLNIDALVEILAYAPTKDYEGETDRYGNEHRAKNFEDFVAGKALLPCLNAPKQIITFLNTEDSGIVYDDIEGIVEVIENYESGTQKPFYGVADVLIWSTVEGDNIKPERYVSLYNAMTGCHMTEEEFTKYVK